MGRKKAGTRETNWLSRMEAAAKILIEPLPALETVRVNNSLKDAIGLVTNNSKCFNLRNEAILYPVKASFIPTAAQSNRFAKLINKVKSIEEDISEGLTIYNDSYRLRVAEEKLVNCFLDIEVDFLENMDHASYIARVSDIMEFIARKHHLPRLANPDLAFQQTGEEIKKRTPTPKTLFLEGVKPEPYKNLLKSAEPPIVDRVNGNYIGGIRGKSSIVAWFDAMKFSGGIVFGGLTAEEKAVITNAIVPGLNITGRTFNNPADNNYFNYFLFELNKMK